MLPYYGRDNGAKGNLFQKHLCQHAVAPRTVAVSAPDTATGHCQPAPSPVTPKHSQANLAQSLVGSLGLSPGSWCTQGFVCALQQPVSPVLWKIGNRIPLAFQVKFSGASQSLCQISRLGNLLWALEFLQQCENFFSIIVLQFVGCLLGGSMVELSLFQEGFWHTLCLPGLLQPEPLSPRQVTADPCLHRRQSYTQRQV